MTASRPRIAIIIARLGPYHVARLAAAGRRFGPGGVIVLEVASESREYQWDRVQGDGFRRKTLITDRDYQDVSALELRRVMIRALEEEQPDAVAVNGWGFPEARGAIRWCRLRGRPAVLMSDSQFRDARRNWVKERLKAAILAQVDAAIVPGLRHAEYLGQLGMDRARIEFGYDAVDNGHFARGAEIARVNATDARRRLAVPEKYLVASARFIPKKNIGRLLEAYRMYRRQVGCRAWDLVLVGDGPERGRIEELVKALQLRASVHMPGFRQYSELPAYYGLAKALILPSTAEQWGLVVNEAMASGIPVLVSWACGAAELVREGVTGYRFDAESLADMARAMVQMTNDEPRLDAMGAAARNMVSQVSPEAFADGLARALESASRHAAMRKRQRVPPIAVWV